MEIYKNLKQVSEVNHAKEKKKYNKIAILRLIAVLGCAYFLYTFFTTLSGLYLFLFIINLALFIRLLTIHLKISKAKKITENLILINQNELDFLNDGKLPFDNGKHYTDTQHLYTYDLDFFGDNSIFQNLNRTETHLGNKTLAKLLQSSLPKNEIELNQEAVKELASKIEWRQQLSVLGKIANDNEENVTIFKHWAKQKHDDLPKVTIILAYFLPILMGLLFIVSYIITIPYLFTILLSLFIINLLVTYTYLKNIKAQIINSDKISNIIKGYSEIIKLIEDEKFESKKLNKLKEQLNYNNQPTSIHIKKLGSLISSLENILNVMGALIMNGFMLYHIHNLNAILKWRKNNKQHVEDWLTVIGEFEALSSLANFSYNNKSFVYPEINNKSVVEFKDLGHPLIPSQRRISNSVSFNNNNMMILTGSNMAGKSTFLRTLGVNMVLAGIGSPICAIAANISPLKVVVSMRQADSLNDNESYFFVEIKRLKQIIDQVASGNCFVLLDEILRGTNSEDKQQGTIKVIEKLISKKAIGVIATHDLTVCNTAEEYPDLLSNKCFEVEIKNNKLEFDYKLRDGICKNKSASFLMKKLAVID